MSGVISFMPRARRVLCSARPGHDRPGHPGELVGKSYGRDLGGSPREQRREPRPMPGAMDLRVTDDSQCSSREQAAQVTIAALTNITEPLFAAARVLLRHQSNPG